jgi:hypothetical protein
MSSRSAPFPAKSVYLGCVRADDASRPAGTVVLWLVALVCVGVPVGGISWAMVGFNGSRYQSAMDANRRKAAVLSAALTSASPDTAGEVRAIADRHGDIEAFEAHADRARVEVEIATFYATVSGSESLAHGCFEYVWSYADAVSSYTEVECGR